MIDQPPVAPPRGSGLAFLQHWDWVAERGLMPRNTAMAIRAVVSQVLKLQDGWEQVDVRQLDVEALLARLRNLTKVAPASLRTYESRFRTGLDSYLEYLENPTTYQPKGRRVPNRRNDQGPARNAKGARAPRPQKGGASRLPSPSPVGGPRLIVYPFPVRSDVFAELRVPADLTVEEAERMGVFLRAIALSPPESPS